MKIPVPRHIAPAFEPMGMWKRVFMPSSKTYQGSGNGRSVCDICKKSYEFRLKVNYEDRICKHDL